MYVCMYFIVKRICLYYNPKIKITHTEDFKSKKKMRHDHASKGSGEEERSDDDSRVLNQYNSYGGT